MLNIDSFSQAASKVALGGLVALGATGCSTFNDAAQVNSLPTPKYVAGPTATAVVQVEACDRLNIKVWEDNYTNRNTLRNANSLFSTKTVEQYRGHLLEYNDVSLAKVAVVFGATIGRNSTAGIIFGGMFGYLGGNELDKTLGPAQLASLRACKNQLDVDQSLRGSRGAYAPVPSQYYQPYQQPTRPIYSNGRDLLGRPIMP